MKEIVMIPIGELYHHPENPRKDLGDISELTESIRKNGVFQNLTVVKGHWMTKAEFVAEARAEGADKASAEGMYRPEDAWTDEGYTVVIGNRRMEASKAAGLAEVPCVISEMDHREQIATMLEENMQRSDLTVYEQAQGFQMMMDLGYSAKEISEKTGFTQKTVKDRLKLAKLNKKHFTDAVNQGATLLDLIEVTKLESKTAQNEVLKFAGTENFRQRMQNALRDQEFEKNKKRLVPVLNEMGLKEIPQNERYSSKWEREWSEDFRMEGSEDDLRKTIKKLMKKTPDVPFVYELNNYGSGGKITFSHGKPKAGPMSEEEKTERQKSIARGKHLRKVKAFWEQAYELRKDFVANYSTAVNGTGMTTIGKMIIRYALSARTTWGEVLPENHKWNGAYIREVLGLKTEEYEDKKTIWEMLEGRSDIPMIRAVVAWIVGGGIFWPDAPEHGLYDNYDGEYAANSYQANGIKELYQFLVEIGYQMSDMEKQLMDGTHECFGKGEETNGET